MFLGHTANGKLVNDKVKLYLHFVNPWIISSMGDFLQRSFSHHKKVKSHPPFFCNGEENNYGTTVHLKSYCFESWECFFRMTGMIFVHYFGVLYFLEVGQQSWNTINSRPRLMPKLKRPALWGLPASETWYEIVSVWSRAGIGKNWACGSCLLLMGVSYQIFPFHSIQCVLLSEFLPSCMTKLGPTFPTLCM